MLQQRCKEMQIYAIYLIDDTMGANFQIDQLEGSAAKAEPWASKDFEKDDRGHIDFIG